MAIRTSRPLGNDGVVVFMARSVEEAIQARDALLDKELTVEDMPEDALRTMFDDGQDSVAVRVSAADFAKAMDVIDALFPNRSNPVDGDEDEPDDELDDGKDDEADSGGDPDARTAVSDAGRMEVGDDEAAQLRRQTKLRQLDKSAGRLPLIAGGSFFLPGVGALFAVFAIYGAVWVFPKAAVLESGKARQSGLIAIGLGALSLVFHAVVIWAFVSGKLMPPPGAQ